MRLVDPEGQHAHVLVPPDQLSLAIGREGQNVRLAAKLTGQLILRQVLHFVLLYLLRDLIDREELVHERVDLLGQQVSQDQLLLDLKSLKYTVLGQMTI